MNHDRAAARSASIRRQAIAAGVMLLACAAASAETSPYVIGGSQSYSHDSNFLRLPDGDTLGAGETGAMTDWISTTSLFGGIDQPFGRQRFYANASLQKNHYRYNSLYNHTGYGLVSGLDWSSAERLSGNLAYSANRALAGFDRVVVGSGPNLVRNIQRTQQLSATLRAGVVTDLTLEGGYNHQAQRFTVFGDRLDQDVYSLGLRERLGGELTIGAGLRLVRGRYADRDDSFKGHDLDLNASWVPSPISSVNARLSIGQRNHDQASVQDFSGATGALSWEWKPSAKLTFNTRLSRATGNDSSFDTSNTFFGPVSVKADNSRLTTTMGLATSYAATAKIGIDASLSRTARKLTNTQSANAAQTSETGNDRLNRFTLGVHYDPTRTVELACNYVREGRSADNLALSYTYHSTLVGCSAQLSLNP